jgi:hypothetical protein
MPSMSELIGLIGRSVKDTDVLAILAPLDVVPSVESDHEEGEIPRHWLQSRGFGFDIEHAPEGRITTVFLFVCGDEEHQPFRGELVEKLSSVVNQNAVRMALGPPSIVREGLNISGLGSYGPADRYDLGAVLIHFEYRADNQQLRLITAMSADAVPR